MRNKGSTLGLFCLYFTVRATVRRGKTNLYSSETSFLPAWSCVNCVISDPQSFGNANWKVLPDMGLSDKNSVVWGGAEIIRKTLITWDKRITCAYQVQRQEHQVSACSSPQPRYVAELCARRAYPIAHAFLHLRERERAVTEKTFQ